MTVDDDIPAGLTEAMGVALTLMEGSNYSCPSLPQVRGLQAGIYRHFKGGWYWVLGVVRSSEDTDAQLVVYRALQGDRDCWTRPLAMFSEDVEVAGERVPRFAFICPIPA